MPLRDLLCVSLVFVGAGCLLGGYRLFHAGVGIKGHNLAPATFFAGFGAFIIVMVIMLTLGPWREPTSGVFPMRVIDLNAPSEPIQHRAPVAQPPLPAQSGQP
jgi:hypothetical protein